MFQLQREGRKDVWLRLDRRTAEEAGMTGLVLGMGVTAANDLVRIWRVQKTVIEN